MNSLKKNKKRNRGLLLLLLLLLITGCGAKKSSGISLRNGSSSVVDTAKEMDDSDEISSDSPREGSIYEHETSAMVLSVDVEKQQVGLMDLLEGKELTLTWSGGTKVFSEYDSVLSMAQVELGEMAEIRYDVEAGTLVSLQISKDAWEYTDITNYTWDNENEMFLIGDRKYRYDSRLRLFSDGEDFEISSLVDGDSFTMRGYDNYVYSIVLDKGHGYVQLANDDYFIGGWMEIGNKVMRVITEDMLVVVPEGSYTMTVSNHGAIGKEEITVERDKELMVDVSRFEGEPPKSGQVQFQITPEEATLYLNGEVVDQDEKQNLEYGTYRITLKAAGYETMSRTLLVHSEEAVISLDMTQQAAAASDTAEAASGSAVQTATGTAQTATGTAQTAAGNTAAARTATGSARQTAGSTTASANQSTSGNSTGNTSSSGTNTSQSFSTETVPTSNDAATAEYTYDSGDSDLFVDTNEVQTIDGYKIYVKEPADTIVFFDGNYAGTVPAAIPKQSGVHTISLKKSGCETRTYTVMVNADHEDLFLSYEELPAS